MSNLKKFNTFLRTVNVAKYRAKYSHIKLVELDLPRNIQAIAPLYEAYWDVRGAAYPSFDKFYRGYTKALATDLEEFRKKTMFSEETFYRGLPARIYRTWASLLTQIQGGYAAAQLYGAKNVRMSAELDYSGIDMQITAKDGEIFNVQIKKESLSREIRAPAPWHLVKRDRTIVVVTYEVPGCAPLTTKTRKPSIPYSRWEEKWQGKLERLPNGFIIFTPAMFERENITTP